jgi:hypothetical protein
MANPPTIAICITALLTTLISLLLLFNPTMLSTTSLILSPLHRLLSLPSALTATTNPAPIDLNWYPPNATLINDLRAVITGTGVYGFVFNNSDPDAPPGNTYYGSYNW